LPTKGITEGTRQLYPFPAGFRKRIKMKKFEIKKAADNNWMASHNEHPKFTCLFEDKKFYLKRTITGLSSPSGDLNEILLVQKMEKWLTRYHKDKINQ